MGYKIIKEKDGSVRVFKNAVEASVRDVRVFSLFNINIPSAAAPENKLINKGKNPDIPDIPDGTKNTQPQLSGNIDKLPLKCQGFKNSENTDPSKKDWSRLQDEI